MTIYKDDKMVAAYYNADANLNNLKNMILDLCSLYFNLEGEEIENEDDRC